MNPNQLRVVANAFFNPPPGGIRAARLGFFPAGPVEPGVYEIFFRPIYYTVRVDRVALADYKRRSVAKSDSHRRLVRQEHGLLFRTRVTGTAIRFSTQQLLSEVVLKFGLLGLVSQGIDVMWQYVFPIFLGVDYGATVFRSVSQSDVKRGGRGAVVEAAMKKKNS